MAANAEHLGFGQRHERQAQALLQDDVARANSGLESVQCANLRVGMSPRREATAGWGERGEGGHGYQRPSGHFAWGIRAFSCIKHPHSLHCCTPALKCGQVAQMVRRVVESAIFILSGRQGKCNHRPSFVLGVREIFTYCHRARWNCKYSLRSDNAVYV